MQTEWCYGMLATISMRDYAAEGHPQHTIAVLADARGTRVIKKWKSDEYPQSLYSAMDEVGKEGWIIGPALWVPFDDGRADFGMNNLPAWISAAIVSVVEGAGRSNGYTSYPLRRSRE